MTDMQKLYTICSLSDFMNYLGMDSEYDDDYVVRNKVNQAYRYAGGELDETLGENYPVDHPLTKELVLLYATISYEQRAFTDNEEKRANQIAQKIRLRMRRKSNG